MIITEWPIRCMCGYEVRRVGGAPEPNFVDDGIPHFVLLAQCEECGQMLPVLQSLGDRDYFTALGAYAEFRSKQKAALQKRSKQFSGVQHPTPQNPVSTEKGTP